MDKSDGKKRWGDWVLRDEMLSLEKKGVPSFKFNLAAVSCSAEILYWIFVIMRMDWSTPEIMYNFLEVIRDNLGARV